jgi:GNAT superfamily N-acetyltransferase
MADIDPFETRSGQKITLRLVTKDDVQLLLDLYYRLSPETRRLRFQLYTAKISEERVLQEARKLSDLNPQLQVAIVGLVQEADGQEHAVGVARFARTTPASTEAEVAVVIRDDFQRKGLGKYLLLTLADRARALQITHFTGWVMADNVRLMKLVKGLELKNMQSDLRYGQIQIRMPII